MLDAIPLELVGIGGAEDFIACDLGRDNLTDDVPIREADDEAVFRGVVFVLGLCDETLPSIVVRLSSPTTLVLGLVAATIPLAMVRNRGSRIEIYLYL